MNKEIWLWLLLVMGAYNPRTIELVEKCGSARAAAVEIRGGRVMLTDEQRKRAAEIRMREVRAVMAECKKNSISILTIEDENYPILLKNIFNPPIVLFVLGDTGALDNKAALAVVGTRGCSQYAAYAARRICGELARIGVAMISGLAVGIDSIAHRSAVENGGCTVGVLACGCLVDYPKASCELKRDIIRSGGAVISELLPHTGVNREYFQHRNRIISGLAHGTFIVEAPEISGCHFTADAAIREDRQLLCLPPYNVFSTACSGVNRYLRDGATPVFDSVDIANALKYQIFRRMD